MRNSLFLAVALLCAAAPTLSAQSFGLRIGLNATDAKVDIDDREIDTDGQTNLMLGAFLNLPIGTNVFSIQPEFNYLNRGFSYDREVDLAGQSIEFDRTLSYIDLGVLARLNFGTSDGLGFYVGAGPQFSYAVSGQVTTLNVAGERVERDIDFDSDRLNRGELQFAAIAGLSYDLGIRVFAEARYNGAFANSSDLDREDIRQRSIGANVGVMVPFGN